MDEKNRHNQRAEKRESEGEREMFRAQQQRLHKNKRTGKKKKSVHPNTVEYQCFFFLTPKQDVFISRVSSTCFKIFSLL